MRKKISPYCCNAKTMRQQTRSAGAGVKLRAWMKQIKGGRTPSRAPGEIKCRKRMNDRQTHEQRENIGNVSEGGEDRGKEKDKKDEVETKVEEKEEEEEE